MALKVFLNQLGQDVIDFIEYHSGGGSGSATLDKTIVSNIAVGAAKAGTTFPENMTFTQFAETILRQDVAPNVQTTFSGSGLFEKGTLVNGTNITVNIKNLADVTLPINTIEFYKDNTLIQSMPFVEGQSSYNYSYANIIKENTTFKTVLTYNLNQKITNTGAFTFVYASYYGATTLSAITNSDAENLISVFTKVIKNTKSLNWNNIILNDERFCYLYPCSLGELSSIKDGNGFEQIDSYTRSQVTITNPKDGENVQYYCYLLTDAATGTGFSQNYS